MWARIIFFQPSIYTAVVLTNMTRLRAVVERVGVVRARLLAAMRERRAGVVAIMTCRVVVGVGGGGQLPTMVGVGAARRRRRGAEGQPFEPHGV